MRTEPSIPSSSMNFLSFISNKTYPSAGTDAIKSFLTVVPQGGSSNAYFRSAIIKLFLQLFTQKISFPLPLAGVSSNSRRSGQNKTEGKPLSKGIVTRNEISLMVSTYKNNITWMYVRTNRILIGSQLKKSRITFMRRDLPQNYALMPVLFLDKKCLLSVTCY